MKGSAGELATLPRVSSRAHVELHHISLPTSPPNRTWASTTGLMQSLLLRASQRLLVTTRVGGSPRTVLNRVSPRPRTFHASVSRRTEAKPSFKKCPVCSQPLLSSVPACNKCWNIFALPKDITHHELLGLNYDPNPFIVDVPTLKKRFRDAQSVCHPDSWASRNPVSTFRPFI
jgi:hypothetical protein